MVQKFTVVQNNHVIVCYNQLFKAVSVAHADDVDNPTFFAGFDGLEEMYNQFFDVFSANITHADACEYFKPQQNFTINASNKTTD